MKAKEYIEKYKAALEAADFETRANAASDMLMEFSTEAKGIMKKRGVERNSAALAVLKEQNTKWNAVVNTYPEVLRRDGFKEFWLYIMPELKKVWR